MRAIIEVSGADRVAFLQGLVTNDVRRAPCWAALLTPQGKYLADFFIVPTGELLLVDVAEPLAADMLRRLSMYRLRAAVDLRLSDLAVMAGPGDPPAGAIADPRDPRLGWRAYGPAGGAAPVPAGLPRDIWTNMSWDAVRVELGVPETGIELIPNETFVLEAGFERLNGVDFRKGCYVGQEVTARMKHKTELRRGLRTVAVAGAAPVGTPILTAEGKDAGTLYTQAAGRGLAMLRLDRAGAGMVAGAARIDA